MAARRTEPGDKDEQATSSKKPAARIGKQMIGAYLTTANVEKIRAVVWRRSRHRKRVTMQDAVLRGCACIRKVREGHGARR